jgi:hypothetical protein
METLHGHNGRLLLREKWWRQEGRLVWDAIKDIASWFIPQMDADPIIQYWWRVRLALTTLFSLLVGLSLAAAVFGFIPHVDGFARSTEVSAQLNAVITEVRNNRIEGMQNALFNLRTKQCTAQSEDAKQLYQRQLIELELKFEELTRHTYPLPACNDL